MSFFSLVVTKHTNHGKKKKKNAPKILSYNCLQQKKNNVWDAGTERYRKQSYFLDLGTSSWHSNKLKWILLTMASDLSPNVENCRPEVIGLGKNTWAAARRLEHSWERAGLFLTSTCAVNLFCYHLLQKPWASFLASHRSYRKSPWRRITMTNFHRQCQDGCPSSHCQNTKKQGNYFSKSALRLATFWTKSWKLKSSEI